jgi:hypothetical protein
MLEEKEDNKQHHDRKHNAAANEPDTAQERPSTNDAEHQCEQQEGCPDAEFQSDVIRSGREQAKKRPNDSERKADERQATRTPFLLRKLRPPSRSNAYRPFGEPRVRQCQSPSCHDLPSDFFFSQASNACFTWGFSRYIITQIFMPMTNRCQRKVPDEARIMSAA